MLVKKLIIFLTLVLVAMVGFSLLKPKLNFLQANLPEPTPAPLPKEEPTGTFVDGLLGDFVFYREGGFYHVALPSRRATQLAGISEDVVAKFPRVRTAWSHEGKLFALVADDKSVVVVDFASGELVGRITLDPSLNLSQETQISFSPDDLFLLVKQNLSSDQSHLRFYELASGKLMLEEKSCDPVGVWMSKLGIFVTTCQIEGQRVIVQLDPYLGQSGVGRIVSGQEYTLINEFDGESLLVKKKNQPGKLTLAGKFTALASKSFESLGTIEVFSDLSKALAAKIVELKKTEAIDDLVVSPSNNFALFHTNKGLWLIDLPLKSDPYFLFAGELPSIRPL